MEDKKYEIEFTMEELEVLRLALRPTADFCRSLVFYSKENGNGNLEHYLDMAERLRANINTIININKPQKK